MHRLTDTSSDLGRKELIRVFAYHLRVQRGEWVGGLWNIGTHPIVWNRNFLSKSYLHLGPKTELDGLFQPLHALFVQFIFFDNVESQMNRAMKATSVSISQMYKKH